MSLLHKTDSNNATQMHFGSCIVFSSKNNLQQKTQTDDPFCFAHEWEGKARSPISSRLIPLRPPGVTRPRPIPTSALRRRACARPVVRVLPVGRMWRSETGEGEAQSEEGRSPVAHCPSFTYGDPMARPRSANDDVRPGRHWC
jgi:hypothetical protein